MSWDERWEACAGDLAAEVAELPWGWFLIVDYLPDPGRPMGPYTQVSRSAGGFWAEAVGQIYLPDREWPVDEEALAADGWGPPDRDCDNWWQQVEDAEDVARVMLRSLMLARGCPDPGRLVVSTGRHPDPPGDGELLPADVVDLVAARAA